MVAEALPETISDASTEATASNAAAQAADAAASTTQDEADTAVEAFLGASKEGTGSDAGKEADGGAKAESDPLFDEAVAARAAALHEKAERDRVEQQARDDRAAKLASDERAAKAQHDAGYKARIAKAQALAGRLEERGMDPEFAAELAKEVETDFNSHHADGLKLYESEARKAADSNAQKLVNDAFEKVLGADAVKFLGTTAEPKSYQGMEAALESFRDIARDGYVLKTEAEADKKTSLLEYHRGLVAKGLLKGTTTGQRTTGMGGTGSASYTTKTQARNLHATNQISDAEMRRVNADSSIPEI